MLIFQVVIEKFNMKRYIFGSSGFAKEVYFLLNEVYGINANFCGFIDVIDDKYQISIGDNSFNVINENVFEELAKSDKENIELFIGVATPEVIKKIANKFSDFSFPNLIHSSFIGFENSLKMGCGNIITPGCIFTVDIILESFNIFNTCTCIGHDCFIGSYNIFLPRTQISGNVTIGNSNIFGMNSSVFQGKKIGDNNSFGAYSFVIKNIPDNNSYFGIPATRTIFNR